MVVNTGAFREPTLITAIAERYGTQCVIVAIDARRAVGGYETSIAFGTEATGTDPAAWAKAATDVGAGEILITSIERDGSLEGYELPLIRSVADAVDVPVLACGGAGNWQHFVEGFMTGGASAVCTTNIYHCTESSIRSAKRYLKYAGVDVRV